jgi:hypothetical protein
VDEVDTSGGFIDLRSKARILGQEVPESEQLMEINTDGWAT